MVVKQLPIITQRLHELKADIENSVAEALKWDCTEDTVKQVKTLRTNLGKDFKDLEEQRKIVKTKILEPYNEFEKVYKECVTDIYSVADKQLKERIDTVEDKVKADKLQKVEMYFDEYIASKGIDFITIDAVGLNVTLSISEKKLKETAKAFVDRVCEDLALIDTQEYKEEILYYYKKINSGCYLNASKALQIVIEKNKVLNATKEETVVNEPCTAKTVEPEGHAIAPSTPLVAPTVEDVSEEKQYTMTFRAQGTLAQLKSLKNFMDKEGIRYEQ